MLVSELLSHSQPWPVLVECANLIGSWWAGSREGGRSGGAAPSARLSCGGLALLPAPIRRPSHCEPSSRSDSPATPPRLSVRTVRRSFASIATNSAGSSDYLGSRFSSLARRTSARQAPTLPPPAMSDREASDIVPTGPVGLTRDALRDKDFEDGVSHYSRSFEETSSYLRREASEIRRQVAAYRALHPRVVNEEAEKARLALQEATGKWAEAEMRRKQRAVCKPSLPEFFLRRRLTKTWLDGHVRSEYRQQWQRRRYSRGPATETNVDPRRFQCPSLRPSTIYATRRL